MGANLNLLPDSEQELVSAHRRSFIVTMEPKLMKRSGPQAQILVIKAYSVAQAKRKAVQQVAVKRFSFYNRLSMWKFLKVEDANEQTEPSDSSGT